MKRFDTLSDKAKAVYLKTLELAKVYGEYDWECEKLDCNVCPFNDIYLPCTFKLSKEEWVAWAEEEV